jgi:hypothetical protein
MPTRTDRRVNPAWLTAGAPTGFRAENLPLPYAADGNLSALTTQVMLAVALPLQVGDVVTNLTFVSATTAADTPTNWWFALYSNAATPALLSQTADQTSTAWAANTVMTKALAAPQLITEDGIYYAAIMVKATTPPSLLGHSMGIAAAAGSILSSKVLAQTSGSALTATAPATIASPTTVVNVPLVIAT